MRIPGVMTIIGMTMTGRVTAKTRGIPTKSMAAKAVLTNTGMGINGCTNTTATAGSTTPRTIMRVTAPLKQTSARWISALEPPRCGVIRKDRQNRPKPHLLKPRRFLPRTPARDPAGNTPPRPGLPDATSRFTAGPAVSQTAPGNSSRSNLFRLEEIPVAGLKRRRSAHRLWSGRSRRSRYGRCPLPPPSPRGSDQRAGFEAPAG